MSTRKLEADIRFTLQRAADERDIFVHAATPEVAERVARYIADTAKGADECGCYFTVQVGEPRPANYGPGARCSIHVAYQTSANWVGNETRLPVPSEETIQRMVDVDVECRRLADLWNTFYELRKAAEYDPEKDGDL